MVTIRAFVPEDAFTAETLGTERAGHGVVIDHDGLVLTIGYLVTEAETVWINFANGSAVQGHVLGYDQETGFGLLRALGRVDVPAVSLGSSARAEIGERVVVGGLGRSDSVAARIVAKQEFAGYWEYVLDEAIFTAPSHPNWGGTAVIGPSGDLIGIGSLQVQHVARDKSAQNINMIVPIDLLKPILADMVSTGRANRPPRPWLGVYATEMNNRLVVAGVSQKGPAKSAGITAGDVLLEVAGESVRDLARMFRRIWSLGDAGVEVPMRVSRDGRTLEVRVKSGDRRQFLRRPVLH
ncbi:MAG TPA: S1C family serine protease [Hyphomicrobiaceae bacterium]|nr:S1C family serine protease [Hyphomicrobiaceae bacterium]